MQRMSTPKKPQEVAKHTPATVREDGAIQWRKEGRGRLTLADGIVIDQPNQVFWARPDEISPAFRDTVKPLRDIPVPAEEILNVIESKYTAKEVPIGSGKFEIIDHQGKIVNAEPLDAKQAEEMIKKLQGQE